MMLRNNQILILALLVLIACNVGFSRKLGPTELIAWFKDKSADFKHEKTIGEYTFKLQFVPTDVQILREIEDPINISESYYTQRKLELKDKIFCYFEIAPTSLDKTLLETETSNPLEYGNRLNYFISHAEKDIYLVQGEDTLNCLNYHFENTYGLKKSNTLSMTFELTKNTKDIEFVFDEKTLNTGPVIFQQTAFEKLKIPTLQIN